MGEGHARENLKAKMFGQTSGDEDREVQKGGEGGG